MTSLRYNRKNLTISTSLFVIVLILVSFVFYRAGVAPLFSMGTPTALALLVFMSLLVLVVISLGIFQSIGLWTYRIEFDDTFLETHMARVPFAWHFKCAYADITQVRKLAPGVIEIVPRKGKPLQIAPRGFAGGEAAVFETLAQHIPAERFEPGLRENLMKLDPLYKTYYALLIGWLLFSAAAWMIQLLPLPIAWTQFDPWAWRYEPIAGFTIESPSSVWIARLGYQSYDINAEHIHNGQSQTWPLLANQLGQSDRFHYLILASPKQEPVLVSDQNIYSFENGAWQRQAYPTGYYASPDSTQAALLSNDAWVVLDNFDQPSQLVHIRAGDRVPQKVDLPVAAGQAKLWNAKTLADGTVLVETANALYAFKNGAWQKQDYPLERKDNLSIQDFTVAGDGNAYVLFVPGIGIGENFIERIDPQGRQAWTQIPAPVETQIGNNLYYESFEVDARGRLWIAGSFSDFVQVLEPVWGGVAREIVEYSTYNSSYQSGFSNTLLRTADGRIWTADSNLVWIDSNAADLPAPLPRWLAQARESGIITSMISASEIIVAILIVFFVWRTRFKKK